MLYFQCPLGCKHLKWSNARITGSRSLNNGILNLKKSISVTVWFMFSLSKSIYRDFLHPGREGYLSWPQEPTFPTNHWKVHFAGALSEGRGDVDAFHDFLMPAARRDHVFWEDHPMSPMCIRRLGSCCYGQSHSEWWKLFKSPKTSVMLESLAWNMLVHWLVGSPAWGLNKMYQFYCQFFQSDLPFNPWFEMLFQSLWFRTEANKNKIFFGGPSFQTSIVVIFAP